MAASFGSPARRKPCTLEPRMLAEQPDELLPDHACRAENADLESARIA